MKKFISLVISLLLLCPAACADGDKTIAAAYDISSKKLSISIDFKSKTPFTLTIAEHSEDYDFSPDNTPSYIYLHDTDDNGAFNIDITPAESWKSGRYDILADSDGAAFLTDFIFLNVNDENTLNIVNMINKADSAEEIIAVIRADDNAEKLGIDISSHEVSEGMSNAAEYCLNIKKSDYDPMSFYETFKKGLGVYKLLDALKESEVYGEVQKILTENAEVFGIDLKGDITKLKNKYKVYMRIFEQREKLDSLSAVKNAFENAVSETYKEESSKKQSGGFSGSPSQGGRSGNSDAKVVIPPVDSEENKPSEVGFWDTVNHFCKEAAEILNKKGVISGYPDNTFRPDKSVTRAEFSKMCALLFGIKTYKRSSFEDVSENDWFYDYVSALSERRIILGYNGFFNPLSKIKREDAAVIIARILELKGIGLDEKDYFDDSDSVSDYAKDAVASLYALKAVNGDNGKFKPRDYITRGETAVLLNNINKLADGGVTVE